MTLLEESSKSMQVNIFQDDSQKCTKVNTPVILHLKIKEISAENYEKHTFQAPC